MDPDPAAALSVAGSVTGASLIVAVFLVLRALLSAGEAAIHGVGHARARTLADAAGAAGGALLRLKDDPDHASACIRAAMSLLLVTASATAAASVAARGPAWALGAGTITWFVGTLADIWPRSVAAADPERWALRMAVRLWRTRVLLSPLLRLAAVLWVPVSRLTGIPVRVSLPRPPLEDIAQMLVHEPQEGAPEAALVRSVFEFGDRTVKEIMVPRTDVVAISLGATPDELILHLVEEGHTRVPVYRDTLDTIVGMIHVKDVLPLVTHPELILLHDLLRPVPFVTWNRPIQQVLRQLQQMGQHLAVVVDEYGGVAGIVTLEDIVEQLVGDIRDEFDEAGDDVVRSGDDGVQIRADMRVGTFNDRFGAALPSEEGFETVGGLLCALAGAIPEAGDCFFHGGFEFEVLTREPRRVLDIRVRRTRAGTAPLGELPSIPTALTIHSPLSPPGGDRRD